MQLQESDGLRAPSGVTDSLIPYQFNTNTNIDLNVMFSWNHVRSVCKITKMSQKGVMD
jgi:hypothetical protein